MTFKSDCSAQQKPNWDRGNKLVTESSYLLLYNLCITELCHQSNICKALHVAMAEIYPAFVLSVSPDLLSCLTLCSSLSISLISPLVFKASPPILIGQVVFGLNAVSFQCSMVPDSFLDWFSGPCLFPGFCLWLFLVICLPTWFL